MIHFILNYLFEILVFLIVASYFLIRLHWIKKKKLINLLFKEHVLISFSYLVLLETITISIFNASTYFSHRLADYGSFLSWMLVFVMIYLLLINYDKKKINKIYRHNFYSILFYLLIVCYTVALLIIPLALAGAFILLIIHSIWSLFNKNITFKTTQKLILLGPLFIIAFLIYDGIKYTEKVEIKLDDSYTVCLKINPGVYGFIDINYMKTVKIIGENKRRKFKYISAFHKTDIYLVNIPENQDSIKVIYSPDWERKITYENLEDVKEYSNLDRSVRDFIYNNEIEPVISLE